MDLLDLMVAPALILRVDPDGPVVQGQVDEVLALKNPKLPNGVPTAKIELHQHSDGKWMWSTSAHLSNDGGYGYRVGPKWGKFAGCRDDALHWARKELTNRLKNKDHHDAKKALAWAAKLT